MMLNAVVVRALTAVHTIMSTPPPSPSNDDGFKFRLPHSFSLFLSFMIMISYISSATPVSRSIFERPSGLEMEPVNVKQWVRSS